MFESDKIMFEIYRDKKFNEKFHVVYYTELNENTKHSAINAAMAGTTYYDGFIKSFNKDKAKEIIEDIVALLNEGNMLTRKKIDEMLKDYLP